MTFADVTNTRKKTRINFKSRVPKIKVYIVPIGVTSPEDFLLLPSVPTQKNVSITEVHTEKVPKKLNTVPVTGWAPLPIVSSSNEPPATRIQLKAPESPSKSKKQSKKGGCFMLAWYKLYLDSCDMYHTLFVTSLLQDVKEAETTPHGNCNAGVTSMKRKGYWGTFHM